MLIGFADCKTITRAFIWSVDCFPDLLATSVIQVQRNTLTANLYSLYYLSFGPTRFGSSYPSLERTKYTWINTWNTTHLGIHVWYLLYVVLVDGSKQPKHVGENGIWYTIFKLNVILFPWICINNCFAHGKWKIVSFYHALSQKVN